MKSLLAMVGAVLLVGAMGCGGDSGGGGTYSCDFTTGGTHSICWTFDFGSLPGQAQDAYKSACSSAAGGMSVSSCPTTGAVGTCSYSYSSAGYTFTEKYTFYTGTAANDMAACSAANQSASGVTTTWTAGS